MLLRSIGRGYCKKKIGCQNFWSKFFDQIASALLKQKREDHIDSLLINDENKLYYVNIKDFGTFMFNKTEY